MSDSKMKTQGSPTTGKLPYIMLAVSIILALNLGMSNAILGDARTIPYDEGDKEDIPSAAARLCNLKCSRVPGGCAHTFDLEVFDTCWEPVYALEIEGLMEALVEPVAWPVGWKAGIAPSLATQPGSMVFYTVDNPILPGAVGTGFGVVSYSGGAALRWFPADEDGILIGKVSRVDLSCPLGTEAQSWGSIKAIYMYK